ncbi:UDP-N-acetylglucosamine 4,6-dehydratase [Lunatimonas lonarensis]|uniref:UDP-N-acetylglucosamine 4,6-dehydratase n=1 Tax=Lunatimonas lonarensis TaxID=1232681 RepID=R7ZXV0_9BACT|nr:nucleoside-diphosphate sugar epimerase/dehydratase [Lunatimonas lonarensis]EON78981.1 UDP-N-acetylglucosamine 4,6-dehydratase [Lunatimonas lonarensis]
MVQVAAKVLRSVNIVPRFAIVFIDAFVLLMAAMAAFFVRSNFESNQLLDMQFLRGSLFYCFVGVAVMYFTKIYNVIVRFSGIRDGIRLFQTLAIQFLLIAIANVAIDHYTGLGYMVPVSVLVIATMISFITLFSYKLAVKDFLYRLKDSQQEKPVRRVLIFGAGDAGVLTHEAIRKDNLYKYINCGFLDDDPRKKGKYVQSIKILGGMEVLDEVIEKYQPDELIVAALDIGYDRKKEIMEEALDKGLKVYTIPPVNQWVSGELETNSIRKINIEDLLGRKSIKLKNELVSEELRGKVVLVSGAAGSIGKELTKQISRAEPKKLLILDMAESALYDVENMLKRCAPEVDVEVLLADVRRRPMVEEIFDQFRPEYVFHAAAYKHVPMMEKYPKEAFMANVWGTKNMADAALKYKTRKFVMVSTDKAVNPTNVMGASKRMAEMYIQSLNQRLCLEQPGEHPLYITTRFGNVLGSNGSVIPLFTQQIEEGGPVTVTDPEMTRYFMTIPEACELVLEAGVMGDGGEIYVFDMGKPVKIVDLAKKLIHLSGKKLGVDIDIKYVGLREGEKMYEELLNNGESTHNFKKHEKIFIANVLPGNFDEIDTCISRCKELTEANTDWNLVQEMKRMVPEYISASSRFEALDKKFVDEK